MLSGDACDGIDLSGYVTNFEFYGVVGERFAGEAEDVRLLAGDFEVKMVKVKVKDSEVTGHVRMGLEEDRGKYRYNKISSNRLWVIADSQCNLEKQTGLPAYYVSYFKIS